MNDCEIMGCEKTAELFCDGAIYCSECGIEVSNTTSIETQPIMLASELSKMSDEEKQFIDPLTVMVDDEEREYDTYGVNHLGKVEDIVATNGLTMFNEPIVMARCVFCEAYAIGHINKVGGWFARHQHYHTHAEDDDDYAISS